MLRYKSSLYLYYYSNSRAYVMLCQLSIFSHQETIHGFQKRHSASFRCHRRGTTEIHSISLQVQRSSSEIIDWQRSVRSWHKYQQCYNINLTQKNKTHLVRKITNSSDHTTNNINHSPQCKQHISVLEQYPHPSQSKDYPTQTQMIRQPTSFLTSPSSMMMAVDAAPLQYW